MKGKRVYPNENEGLSLNDGEYAFYKSEWYCKTPNGWYGRLKKHKITEHENGTITVSPSILISAVGGPEKGKQLWHGFLEHGVWREV